MVKEFVCIVCPVGCNLRAEYERGDKSSVVVSGNKCRRGELYAVDELMDPKRVLTTTVVIDSDSHNRLPVKTDNPIPKGSMLQAMAEINAIRVSAPVNRGDVLLENFIGVGVNVVATKTVL